MAEQQVPTKQIRFKKEVETPVVEFALGEYRGRFEKNAEPFAVPAEEADMLLSQLGDYFELVPAAAAVAQLPVTAAVQAPPKRQEKESGDSSSK